MGQEEEGPGLKQAWRDELRRMYEGTYFGMRIFEAFVGCLVQMNSLELQIKAKIA